MRKKRVRVPFDATFFKKEMAQGIRRTITDTFTFIYNSNHWSGKKSVSGNGSDFSQTQEIRKRLPDLIKDLKIKVMLDLPCGDFNWMNTIDLQVKKYIGADIVLELIESNQKKYADKNRTFQVLDIIKDPLPQADLLFCRDCFVHLSNDDILKALANIRNSRIKYFLTSTFTECEKNEDITSGDWRVINLKKSPFFLPQPKLMINENCTEGAGTYSDKCLGLWVVNEV
jgi:SAM-dependent methyltransferase